MASLWQWLNEPAKVWEVLLLIALTGGCAVPMVRAVLKAWGWW